LAGAALIAVAVVVAYLPSINGGFVMDDNELIINNQLVKSADGLYYFWCTTQTPDYWPVTNSNLWIDWRLWGTHPAGYHATNLILHVVEALLMWIILRKLSIPGAFLAALIFALHPVNVESVAWISQRKNMMAMLFFLLSILWYLKADMPTASVGMAPSRSHGGPWKRENNHSPLWYWLSLAAFLLAMLSKGSVAVLPVLLLGIVWWLRPLGTVPISVPTKTPGTVPISVSTKRGPFSFSRRYLLRIAPFFMVAIILAGVNVWFQTHGRGETIRSADFVQRLLGAGCVPWFYLYKAILPIDLAFVYPQWQIQAGNFCWWLPLPAALIVTAVLWRYRNGWSRPLLFAWGFFCAALAPVMGFMDVGFMKQSLVADHYQHIAVIGVIALAASGISAWHQRAHGTARWATIGLAVPAAGTLMLLTWQQSGLYRGAMTLYQATLDKNPACWMAHNNLGITLADTGRLQDAIDQYRQALQLMPDYPEADNNLGNALIKSARPQEAIEHYERAIRQKPDYAEAHNNLGFALAHIGRPREAIEQYEQAIRLMPYYSEAYNNLGNVMLNMGRMPEAMDYFWQAQRLKPDYPEACNGLGVASIRMDRYPEAIEYFREALRLKFDYPEAHSNLGVALVHTDRPGDAIEQYRQAITFKPDYFEAINNLGNAYKILGQYQQAIEQYRQALALKPDFANIYFNLAMTYAKMRQSSEAVAAAQKALELAKAQGQSDIAKQIEDWLNSYRANP
jgi:tetratricopeptide (TPR) repeat protein